MAYQDIVDGTGQLVEEGYRECASRYEAIRQACANLRRPFTVLDLGAAEGYFSTRLTAEFGARCVAVEPRPVIKPAEPYVAGVVRKAVNAEDVRRLGTYDVTLALSFLHHVHGWEGMLDRLIINTRSLLVVETPHPDEQLRQATNRRELAKIHATLVGRGFVQHEGAPGVWDKSLERGLFTYHRGGYSVSGEVKSGGGNNSAHTRRFAHELKDILGYEPFPGSLNVHTRYAFRLGPYCAEYVDAHRGRGGRRGGDYQIWHARVKGYDGPAHVIRPGVRGHGRRCLEVWAPVRLRDHLGLSDGDELQLRIGA